MSKEVKSSSHIGKYVIGFVVGVVVTILVLVLIGIHL